MGTNDQAAPQHPLDLRLASMQANLLAIYKSGDATKISAIETNLSSLRATIQMEKRSRKKVALSLMEEDESLLNQPAPEKDTRVIGVKTRIKDLSVDTDAIKRGSYKVHLNIVVIVFRCDWLYCCLDKYSEVAQKIGLSVFE